MLIFSLSLFLTGAQSNREAFTNLQQWLLKHEEEEEEADAHLMVLLWEHHHVFSTGLYWIWTPHPTPPLSHWPPCLQGAGREDQDWQGICRWTAAGHLMEFVLSWLDWEAGAGLMTTECVKIWLINPQAIIPLPHSSFSASPPNRVDQQYITSKPGLCVSRSSAVLH